MLSFALHALALLALAAGAPPRPTVPGDGTGPEVTWPVDPAETATLVDLTTADLVPPLPDVPPASPPPPVALNLGAVPGDRTNAVLEAAMRRAEGVKERRAPAPDRGAGAGRPLPDRAWRRDASTLHERLTDGAERNQPSHARTGPAAVSPQAVRREQKTGIGDSARTSQERLASPTTQYGVEDPDAPGVGARTLLGTPVAGPAKTVNAPPLAAAEQVPAADPTQGPLDSDRGARSFDVQARGALAVDDHAARAASNELHPSITDLTVAAVSGNTREGRGPSDTPGAVAQPSRGAAASTSGAPTISDGSAEEARTRERIYNRYTHEIGARVNDALVWPRALAIRLEQGETIVRFVVLPDGKLSDNLRVVKSSGFSEFDQAALDAVRKASPFPPMRDPSGAKPLPVKLPVTFSNPVIR